MVIRIISLVKRVPFVRRPIIVVGERRKNAVAEEKWCRLTRRRHAVGAERIPLGDKTLGLLARERTPLAVGHFFFDL